MDWPKTISGWAGLIATGFLIMGIGGVAGVWKWMKRPLEDKIIKEREARKREIEKITDREHGYLVLHKNALMLRIDDGARATKQDTNSLGAKVNDIEKGTIDREARTRKLEERMRDSEHDRGAIHKDVGALQAEVSSFREEQNQMRIDIIAHIQSAKKEQLDATRELSHRVGEVEKQVAVLNDRQTRDPS